MHYIKALSLLAVLPIGALAGPINVADLLGNLGTGQGQQQNGQVNICGNNVQPYCCDSTQGGNTHCTALSEI